MTTAQALFSLRNLLNESSAGFFTENQCYDFLSRGQDDVVSTLIQKWRQTNDTPLMYFPKALDPLITITDVAFSGTSNVMSLSSYTTLIEIFHAEYYKTAATTRLVLTRLPLGELLKAKANTYSGTGATQTYWATYGTSLLISQDLAPNADYTGVKIHYWVSPTQVASGQEIQISDEAHPAIIKLAMFYALTQDGQHSKAHQYLQEGLKFTTNL